MKTGSVFFIGDIWEMSWTDMIAVGQIRKLGHKGSWFRKDVVVQTENRFLPDPSPEMETETKALSCFLRTGIDMSVCMHFAVFNRVGSKNSNICYVGRWHSCLHCKLKCCQSMYIQWWVGCIWFELWGRCSAGLFCIINWNYCMWAAQLSHFPLFGFFCITSLRCVQIL